MKCTWSRIDDSDKLCARIVEMVICAGIVAAVSGCGQVNKVADANPTDQDGSAACVAESDAEFCAAQAGGNACETQSALDNCGAERSVDCGSCGSGKGCVAGVCKTPVCTTFVYAATPLSALARSGVEDAIAAATPDGQVLVYLQTPGTSGCGSARVVIADEVTPGSGTYMQQDATTLLQSFMLYTGQDGHAITADGLTLIARSTNSKRWLTTKRSAKHMIDFATPSDTDLAQINAQIASTPGTFRAPVISADGLEFIYKVESTNTAERGIYVSVRASTSVPFPAGTRQASPVSDYEFPTGLSSDRLTLFVFDSFTGRVLRRNSTSQPFANPNAPAAPPQIAAWQHKPLADCSKLVAMTSPGGCAGEDVVLLTRQ